MDLRNPVALFLAGEDLCRRELQREGCTLCKYSERREDGQLVTQGTYRTASGSTVAWTAKLVNRKACKLEIFYLAD